MTEEQQRKENRKAIHQVAKYGEIGFLLPAAVIAGWLLGSWLDRLFGTRWLTLSGIIFGIVAGFYQLIRILIKAGKQ